MITIKEEAVLESAELRNKLVENEEAHEKFKKIVAMPDGQSLTTKMVADHYQVDESVIKMTLHRHREELEGDGLKIASRKDVLEDIFEGNITYLSNYVGNKARMVTLFNKRCVRRIGMLLRDSEVAKQLRTYLLNIEEQATQEQKSKAVKGSKWDDKDLILYDRIVVGFPKGKTLTQICKEASEEFGGSVTSWINRYSSKIKPIITNYELIENIARNKGKRKRSKNHLHVVKEPDIIDVQQDEFPEDLGVKIPTWAEVYLNHVVQMNIETNEMVKKAYDDLKEFTGDKITQLEDVLQERDKEIKLLKTRNKKLSNELKQTRAVIASAVKIGVNESIQQTFRMSPNGNLERL